jgi:hypothetical protein
MTDLPGNQKLGMLAGTLLADAAFIFADPSEAFSPSGTSLYLARIVLKFSESWELLLVAEAELARSLAANLLGIDEESDEARSSSGEALGELANILAGSLVMECKGPTQIGIPTVSSEVGVKAVALLGMASRRANLVTETGQHFAVGLRPLEAA